ncbi:MAG: hypothetical protein ABIG44_11515 [Planctomycetota bacterium]
MCQGFRETSSATTPLQWDDFKCGLDNNADGDVDDVGTDYVYADYEYDAPAGRQRAIISTIS